MILSYLEENYKAGEPIFTADIQIDGLTEVNKRQQIKKLIDNGKLVRFEKGIYYLPRKSKLKGGIGISSDMVAQYKYILRNGNRMGYFSGHTLANRLGLSTQVPVKKEIVSNNMSAIVREVAVGYQSYVVRRPIVPVNDHNYKVLQLLDLLKDIQLYADNEAELVQHQLECYIKDNQISRALVDQYIESFPLKTYKSIYEMRLDYVFT